LKTLEAKHIFNVRFTVKNKVKTLVLGRRPNGKWKPDHPQTGCLGGPIFNQETEPEEIRCDRTTYFKMLPRRRATTIYKRP